MGKRRFFVAVELLTLVVLLVGLSLRTPERLTDADSRPEDRLPVIFERISPDSIIETVRLLAAQKSRRFISPGAAAAAESIASRLRRMDLRVEQHHTTARDSAGQPVVVTNVIADLGGSDQARNSLIICAHYDSRGEDWGDPAPGADDNASGVAVLLETARVLTELGIRPRVTLAFFGGEEDDFIGSAAFAKKVSSEGLPLRGVINVDMVGYDEYGPQDIVVFTNPQSVPLASEVIESARSWTRLVADTTVTTTGNSDHASFWEVGEPAVSIWEGYDHNPYHDTSRDTPVHLSKEFLVEMTKLIVSTSVRLGGMVEASPRE